MKIIKFTIILFLISIHFVLGLGQNQILKSPNTSQNEVGKVLKNGTFIRKIKRRLRSNLSSSSSTSNPVESSSSTSTIVNDYLNSYTHNLNLNGNWPNSYHDYSHSFAQNGSPLTSSWTKSSSESPPVSPGQSHFYYQYQNYPNTNNQVVESQNQKDFTYNLNQFQDQGKHFSGRESVIPSSNPPSQSQSDHFYPNYNGHQQVQVQGVQQPSDPTYNPYNYPYNEENSNYIIPHEELKDVGFFKSLINRIKTQFEDNSTPQDSTDTAGEPEESISSIIFQKLYNRWKDSESGDLIPIPGKGVFKRAMKYLGSFFSSEDDSTTGGISISSSGNELVQNLPDYQVIYDGQGNQINTPYLNLNEPMFTWDEVQGRFQPFNFSEKNSVVERVGESAGILGVLGSIGGRYLTLPNALRVLGAGLAYEGIKRSLEGVMDYSSDFFETSDRCVEKMVCDSWRNSFFEMPNEDTYIDWLLDSNMGPLNRIGTGLQSARAGSDCSEFQCGIYPMDNFIQNSGVQNWLPTMDNWFGGGDKNKNIKSRKESKTSGEDKAL